MRPRNGIERLTVDGVDILRLRAHGAQADVAAGLGMCVVAWKCGGVERLHLPAALPAFAASSKTGGVPLLYPWANRLRSDTYRWPATGGDAAVDASVAHLPGLKRDGHGLPIHGLLLRQAAWDELDTWQARDGVGVTAGLAWSPDHPGFAGYPFEHDLFLTIVLGESTLAVAAMVLAHQPMPISFGWHPYLRLPGPRAECRLLLPAREPVPLDDTMLPRRAGGTLQVGPTLPAESRPLAQRTFDDLFRVAARTSSGIDGPDGRVELRGLGGTRFLQVYAPTDSDFVCLEPMTAPAAALSDGADLSSLEPLDRHEAAFELIVR